MKYLAILLPLLLCACAYYHGFTEYNIHTASGKDLCQMARFGDRPAMVDQQIHQRGLNCKTIALPGDQITKQNVNSLSDVDLCKEMEARPNKVISTDVKKRALNCKTLIDRWYQEQQLQLMQQQLEAAEAARQQAAWAAVQNNLNQQRIIQQQQQIQFQNQMNAYRPVYRSPITTNCSRWANQVNCTSY